MPSTMNWPPTHDELYTHLCDSYRRIGYPIPTREWYDNAAKSAKPRSHRSDIQADYDYHRREMGD